MPALRHLRSLLVLAALVCIAGRAAADQLELINDSTPWRISVSFRSPAVGADGEYRMGGGHTPGPGGTRWVLKDFNEPTPPPQSGWREVDFDDSIWPRYTNLPYAPYGYGCNDIYIYCMRGRFGLNQPDRAGKLQLTARYRGGIVVYLNGREIARQHMPQGEVEPLTLAADYPRDAFRGPDGKLLRPINPRSRRKPTGDALKPYNKRLRTLTVTLPQHLLIKGANVLALEMHRSAFPTADEAGGKDSWSPCGPAQVTLVCNTTGADAQIANTAPPQYEHIWNCSPLVRGGMDLQHGDALAPLRPVALNTPRNGVASGQIVVSAPHDLQSITAELGAMTSDTGRTLDPSRIVVRYADLQSPCPALTDTPMPRTTAQPIWLTARLTPDTPAGIYRGTLTIKGLKRPAAVPVELTVHNGMLPDHHAFDISSTFLHCPQSVAAQYGTPLWSDRHFAALEKSFALLGYIGNTMVSVPVIGNDLFGQQSLIVFREENGTYMPDFRYARRYLQLYAKNAPPPRFVSVQVWNYNVSTRGKGRDGGDKKWMTRTIPLAVLKDGKTRLVDVPTYSLPGTKRTWQAVADGLKQIVADVGWKDTRLLWGTAGDNMPTQEIAAFFQEIAPDMKWRVATHINSARRWGPTEADRRQENGMYIGYVNLVRRNINRRQLYPGCTYDVLKRDGLSATPQDYFNLAPLARIAAKYNGFGFTGFDYWPVRGEDGKARTPFKVHAQFGNLKMSGPAWFVVPGPDGALPTPQVEAMREGRQVTQAALQLRAAIDDPERAKAIDPSIRRDARAAIQGLTDVLESNRRRLPQGLADVHRFKVRIYELLAAVDPAD